jgi:hypothetical protein
MNFRVQFRLSLAIFFLAAIASGVGLLLPSVYRETNWVIPQNRGQDLVTLLILVAFLPISFAANKGSIRAYLIWLGLIGYLSYTYTGAAFSYGFNELFPIYLSLFSLTGLSVIFGLMRVDSKLVKQSFSERTPLNFVASFLLLMALLLTVLWVGQIIPFYLSGELPEMILKANTPTVFVFVLDLGIVAPLSVFSAFLILHKHPLGYVLSSLVLVKSATMGWALISMTIFSYFAGTTVSLGLSIAWIALALFGTTVACVYFLHCKTSQLGTFKN